MESEQQIFYITIVSMCVAMITICLKYGYKSKCSEVKLGCITIKRDVITENNYDITHPVEDTEEPENKI